MSGSAMRTLSRIKRPTRRRRAFGRGFYASWAAGAGAGGAGGGPAAAPRFSATCPPPPGAAPAGGGRSGAGDVASREAAQTLVHSYYAGSKNPERALRDAISRANLHVYDLGLKAGSFRMETTLAVVAVTQDKVYIAHVGDSRIYRVRQSGQIEPMTRDHSEVAELVRMQILTPENARHHPRRHVITRSVGNQPIVQSSMRIEMLEPGDTFVLCTDGLWEPLEDAEIAKIVRTHAPAEACRTLVTLALERQTTDNLSVQIVRVTEINKENAAQTPNLPWYDRLLATFGTKRSQ